MKKGFFPIIELGLLLALEIHHLLFLPLILQSRKKGCEEVEKESLSS
jgi:hypothetical protein